MARSLFLFDMTFWLYLASLTLYLAYLFARYMEIGRASCRERV